MSINICELCYVKVVPACQTIYVVNTGLDENITYQLNIEDVNGNVYPYTANPVGALGEWTIDTSIYPNGLFNAFSGDYILTWSTSENFEDQVDLTIDGETYPCIILKFKQVVTL